MWARIVTDAKRTVKIVVLNPVLGKFPPYSPVTVFGHNVNIFNICQATNEYKGGNKFN